MVNWVIDNYVPNSTKFADDFKDKILSFSKLKTNKIICGNRKKLRKPKIKEESKDDIIININIFWNEKKKNN